ncbi:DUF4844 domain-containing protein [Flavobacterium branchiarum]|uniref:DUF4844 domain-containing protein n=1 Tax=Flavobacterium branchiarum TaxID=1114870 RepID=A0ABV5FI38_9FLAO|nr:DUF4844 domain-containing protein [Flavobacterium branchiarum]MDN3674115.1 DUF4844 domain-containing protein [Flavobacterium branchiarum]
MTKEVTKIFLIMLVLLFTCCGQSQIKTPVDAMSKFEKFKNKDKFIEDNSIFYPGIGDQKLKPILTDKINLAADDFKKVAETKNPIDEDYQNAIKKSLERFSEIYIEIDTENRERICLYFEELMDIVGLESSNNQLNDFMYNFDVR